MPFRGVSVLAGGPRVLVAEPQQAALEAGVIVDGDGHLEDEVEEDVEEGGGVPDEEDKGLARRRG